MVGTIEFNWHGVDVVATLGDDFVWSAPPGTDPEILESLNQFYGSEEGADSPAHGQPGAVQLHGTAAALGGKASLAPKPAEPPGTVF